MGKVNKKIDILFFIQLNNSKTFLCVYQKVLFLNHVCCQNGQSYPRRIVKEYNDGVQTLCVILALRKFPPDCPLRKLMKSSFFESCYSGYVFRALCRFASYIHNELLSKKTPSVFALLMYKLAFNDFFYERYDYGYISTFIVSHSGNL